MMGSGSSVSCRDVCILTPSVEIQSLKIRVVVLAIITLARRFMLSVDVDELEGLKYGYKGA